MCVKALSLAHVFFRDERDERDAETTENSKGCALKRCRWRVYFLETKEKLETTETQGQQRKMIADFVVVSLVSLVSLVPVVSSISLVSASP